MTGRLGPRERFRVVAGLLVLASVLSSGPPIPAAPREDLERGVTRLWRAQSPGEREQVAATLTAGASSFGELLAAFRGGPEYSESVARGRLLEAHTIDGIEHPYLVLVPDSYDPARRYPLRFYLHGGVGRQERPGGGNWWRDPARVAREDVISVFPASWDQSRWWRRSQLTSLRRILADLKGRYNVDENRIAMFGVSDGGSGAWYFALLDPTPWAAFVPLIGHPAVLSNPAGGADAQLQVVNLRNRPFLVINGGADRLYPVRSIRPYIDLFEQLGVDVEFVPRPQDGHTVDWWPEESARIEAFLERSVRDPLPMSLVWETSDLESSARFAWLVIDEIDVDARAPGNAGEKVSVPGRPGQYRDPFPRGEPTGRVELRVRANRIDATTRGVRRFRLLLSPEQFDLSQPIEVSINDGPASSYRVTPDPATLVRWAAADLDREQLFAAELPIDLSGRR